MKVLITGGAGYIGALLTKTLASNDLVDEIIIYDNLSRGQTSIFFNQQYHSNKIRFIQGDILDSRLLKRTMVNIDVVYHLAAKTVPPFSDRSAHFFEQVNHWGTAELCYATEAANVSQFIYLSSLSVYSTSDEIINKETIPMPETFYGYSKLQGESHVLRLKDVVNTKIVRCANVFGYSPSIRLDTVINNFMFKSHHNQKARIEGNGTQIRPFIEISRVLLLLEKLLSNNIGANILNLVDHNVTILDILESVRSIYPSLEMIFVNQQLKMRNLHVGIDKDVTDILGDPDKNLSEALNHFSKSFSLDCKS